MRGSMMIATCLEYSMRCSAGPLHHGACIHISESNVNFRLKMLFDFRYTESNFNIQYSHTWLRFYCFVSGIWKKRLHVILLHCVYVRCAWCRCFVNIFGSIWKKIWKIETEWYIDTDTAVWWITFDSLPIFWQNVIKSSCFLKKKKKSPIDFDWYLNWMDIMDGWMRCHSIFYL